MKLMTVLLIGMAAIWATPARAQLGDTPEGCDRRFGPALMEKGSEQFWALSREYQRDGFAITVRFITLSTGVKVAGWIKIEPGDKNRDTAAALEKFRTEASSGWTVVEALKVSADTDAQTVKMTPIHNTHVAATRATIRKITGWETMRCWVSPTAYAAENGSLILFTDTYLKRHEAQAR